MPQRPPRTPPGWRPSRPPQVGRVNFAFGPRVQAGVPGSGWDVVTCRSLRPPRAATACSAMSGGSALPCQPFLSSISGTPLPLMGPRQHHGGPVEVGARQGQGLVDGDGIVAVDDQRAAAEGLDPRGVAAQVPLQLGRPALAQPVDVHDDGEVPEVVGAGPVQGFPDRALGSLAVPAQHPCVTGQLVQVPPGQADPDRVGEPRPSEPVATSTHGRPGVGWPSRRAPVVRSSGRRQTATCSR